MSEQIMGREPYRFMFMESLENFKEQIQICSIEKQSWNSGGRVEARRLIKKLLMRRVMINTWLRDG